MSKLQGTVGFKAKGLGFRVCCRLGLGLGFTRLGFQGFGIRVSA